jgi:hypothetical protein
VEVGADTEQADAIATSAAVAAARHARIQDCDVT